MTERTFHFISGLPRSGSMLLAAILRQNPDVHAHITSPVGSLVGAVLEEASASHEGAVFFTQAPRKAVLRGVLHDSDDSIGPARTVFDTNRARTAQLDLLVKLFPEAKVICWVRDVTWIIDSVERLIRANPFELSKIFGVDGGGNVSSRSDRLRIANGLIGSAFGVIELAMHGDHTGRPLLLTYDTLVRHPEVAMEAVYRFVGLEPFAHDFEDVAFDACDLDARLGTLDLHDVNRQVRPARRKTITPSDVWERHASASLTLAPLRRLLRRKRSNPPPGRRSRPSEPLAFRTPSGRARAARFRPLRAWIDRHDDLHR